MRLACRVVIVLLAFHAFAAEGLFSAQAASQAAWQPSSGHTQVPIWPGEAPDARPAGGPEVAGLVVDAAGGKRLVGGRPWTYVDKVSQPTMTVYPPQGRNTGAAVIVFPGGGYNGLAIDLEGTEACDWLTSKGLTCVLLKYRVPCAKVGPYRDCPTALQDAQRTVGLVRSQAARWHVDPAKIGVLGFSAGGHMVAAISTHFEKRLYPAVDAADKESCRPDFAVALYPGHLALPEKDFVLNPDIQVTGRTPPTFLLQAEDDPVDPVENSLVYYSALRKAGVPAEIHVYVNGGHAFGLRPTDSPITRWPQVVETWLANLGIIRMALARDAEPQHAPPDSIVQFLLDSAATDFHAHRPPDPVRFRDVRIAHVLSPAGEKQYRLCGEFLPAPAAALEGGKEEWMSFVTIKTSGYEQYLGGQAADFCKGSTVTADDGDDMSSSLQSRLDSIR